MNQDFNLTRPAYSVNDLLDMLPLGRTTLYRVIGSGALKATKLGKKTLFLAPDVAAFLNSLSPTIGNNGGDHAA